MRPVLLLASFLLVSHAGASWFSGSDQPEYQSWNEEQLRSWLDEHKINVPKGALQDQLTELVESNWYAGQTWTEKQVEAAKARYDNLKDYAFDTWSESQLHDFLVKQGIVAPSGPREQLVVAANKQYRAYTSAASSVSAAASSAVYGDKLYQATKPATSGVTPSSLLSKIVETTAAAYDQLDDAKDYIYSTWSDNQLRTHLEEKGIIKTKSQAKRDELLVLMKEHYASVADPVWQSWSDSYIFQWLHDRGLVRTDSEKKRDKLVKSMQHYYYGAQDTVYSDWDESELKAWLVDHGIIKSNAQIQKEKLQKLVADNYATALDTAYGGWRDSDMREWLITKGYLRSDAKVKRDELHKLMSEKYTVLRDTSAAYLTWPDARLRAYLRANGVDDKYIPTTRPGLLQEVRVRWIEANNHVESLIQRIRDVISSSVESAEAQLGAILESLTGTGEAVTKKAKQARADAAEKASEKASIASKSAKSLSSSASAASKSAKNEL